MEKFLLGAMLGAVGGALAVANSYKMRMLVKKGQDEAKKRIEEMIDEKLEQMDCQGGECVPSVDQTSEQPKKRSRKNA